MGRTRLKAKGRREKGTFALLPHTILESAEYAELSGNQVKMLLDLFSQYRGYNNGDFTKAWSVLRKRGWRSKGTVERQIKQLLAKGWIVLTRQGGRNKCNLYAVTWIPIDDCSGKLDVSASKIPPGTWRKISLGGPLAGQVSPTVVPIRKTV